MLNSAGSGAREEEFQSRRLREATKYVGRNWLPCSPVVFKRLQTKLNSTGPIDLSDIQAEIRSDFGLFAQCLRKMGATYGDAGTDLNPGQLMRDMPVDGFRAIFATQQSDFSNHELSSIRDVQLNRVKHSVISISAVEVLAERADIDRELAAICAMIRQLGHLFVSWNYPSSCIRSKTNMEASDTMYEDELEKLLGFAPGRLGVEAAIPWCKNPLFLFGLGKCSDEFIEAAKACESRPEESNTLLQLCHAGEILARINDPENYPSASKDWKEADEVLKRFLGPKGTSMIREKIDEIFPHYVTLAPNLFPRDLSPERAARTVNHLYSRKLLEANVYVKRCPEDLKQMFSDVYDKVLQSEASFDAVNTLVTRVIPTAGFFSGCVYMLDPKRMVLVPKLLIGDARGKTYKQVSCSCGGTKSHPVSEAFHCTMPLREENVILNGDVASHITGKFGTGDRIGVLFLQFQDLLPSTIASENHLTYFKAIRQALNDCLNL